MSKTQHHECIRLMITHMDGWDEKLEPTCFFTTHLDGVVVVLDLDEPNVDSSITNP